MTALPYKNSEQSKKDQVEEMFDNISPKYDLLNHLLSANVDKIWRRRSIKKLSPYKPNHILDIATGTGDFAVAATKLKNVKVTGIDISEGMLEVGRRKIEKKVSLNGLFCKRQIQKIYLFNKTILMLSLLDLAYAISKHWKRDCLKSLGF